jgi:two-component system chemotaxis sensor kinase CheA
MTGGGEAFFGQFIDDYYAECDEHLATARRVLLALESETGRAQPTPPDAGLMRELFRSLHTLKGLAGMVGDACAERTSHALEEALREVERSRQPIRADVLDVVFAGVEALDRCVAARRAGDEEPDVTVLLEQLARVSAAANPQKRAAGAGMQPSSDTSGVARNVYRITFAPNPALSQRGVGVDAIRARLAALGTVLDAKPRMAGGGVVFDFRVAVPEGAAPDDAWRDDGVSWELEPPPEPEPEARVTTLEHAIATGARAASGASVVRVDLARVDAVMRHVGDLVTTRSRLDDLLRRQSADGGSAARDALEETSAAMERQLRQLREGVMRLRLVPVGEVFERLRFAARDAIRESGKRVSLVFSGETTEIDKLVVDRMLEPLLHLVRNAVGHGIEAPDERVARGKPPEGTLTLRAIAAGDRIVIDLEDDGRGMDAERIAARALDAGLLAPGETLDADRLLDVLCAPGFSTRDEADLTSGRGVGMDVVWSTVRALSGTLTMSTVPGQGTRFVIELPLTLMILDALLVEIGGQQMAMPQPALREILQIDRGEIIAFESNEVVNYRGGVLPLVNLTRLFELPPSPRDTAYVLVVGTEQAPMGLMVDRLLALREIVVHPVTDPLVAMPGVAGATDLGDGRVSLILDAAALVRLSHERREQRARRRTSATPGPLVRDLHARHLSA